jgi:flagellar biosynthesis protein FlhF
MKIKKYIANTLQEGKSRVLRELGEDAVILSTRNINKPGDSSASLIEIVAAIDDNIKQTETIEPTPNRNKYQEPEENTDENQLFYEATSKMFDEIGVVKSMISEVTDLIKYKNLSNLSPVNTQLYKILLDSGFTDDFAFNTILKINGNNSNNNLLALIKQISQFVIDKIEMMQALNISDNKQVITFIGSSGSGKTTTLIKLAIILKLILQARILIVSTDTQKVAGPDQLQTFSSIAGIQFRIAHNNLDLKEIISKEIQYDFIMVDTSGFSQFHSASIEELHNTLYKIESNFTFLILQANLNRSTLISNINTFKQFKPNGIILTKIDENVNFGELFEALLKEKLPIAYYCTGQSVPDDIEPADKEKLAELIISTKSIEV